MKKKVESYQKCCYHETSERYQTHQKKYQEILRSDEKFLVATNLSTPINVKIVFHFIAPENTYVKANIMSRANDIILSLNEDFNNYATNLNSVNNFKYKNIVNKVFINNQEKQNTYLSSTYLKTIPKAASNIIFELGDIIFYNVSKNLNLTPYDDVREIDVEYQLIKQTIQNNRAQAINPEFNLNVWVMDMIGTSILGFANFPWDPIDNYHGVVIGRRIFEPEFNRETNFTKFKTLTHEVGHYFGLLHTFSRNYQEGEYALAENQRGGGDYVDDTPEQQIPTYNPLDLDANRQLHNSPSYNPLFMNFMDYTYDNYVSNFTMDQIIKMRYMIYKYRPALTRNLNNTKMANNASGVPSASFENGSIKTKEIKSVPSLSVYKSNHNPRLMAHNLSNTKEDTERASVGTQNSYLQYSNVSKQSLMSNNEPVMQPSEPHTNMHNYAAVQSPPTNNSNMQFSSASAMQPPISSSRETSNNSYYYPPNVMPQSPYPQYQSSGMSQSYNYFQPSWNYMVPGWNPYAPQQPINQNPQMSNLENSRKPQLGAEMNWGAGSGMHHYWNYNNAPKKKQPMMNQSQFYTRPPINNTMMK